MHPKVAESQHHLSMVSPIQLGAGDQVAGTVFRKQIMSYGRWVNPNWWWDEELWMELTEDIADQMIDNFNAKTFGKRISVPRNHTGDVNANAGEVIKLEKATTGLWAYLDIRDPKTVADIENGLIFDVSMGFDLDYVDQKEGLHHGATLIHVALVTDPYLNNMDDFAKADKTKLSKAFDDWAGSFGFGKTQPSIIMMSKSNVEELKRMKFAKVTNDKEHDVEVTYTDAEGKEVKQTVAAGAEIEVPTEAEEAVKTQIAESTAPDEGGEGEGEGEGSGEGEGAGSGEGGEGEGEGSGAGEGEGEGSGAGTGEGDKELARLRARNAELEAEKAYGTLLSAGKITPAQKALFMAFAKNGGNTELKFSSDVKTVDGKKVLFAKGATTSAITVLSAILEAGPKVVKFGEQGGQGEATVELTKEQEATLKRRGINVETFKKNLKEGKITLEDVDNG